jgi:hypothetical protein
VRKEVEQEKKKKDRIINCHQLLLLLLLLVYVIIEVCDAWWNKDRKETRVYEREKKKIGPSISK